MCIHMCVRVKLCTGRYENLVLINYCTNYQNKQCYLYINNYHGSKLLILRIPFHNGYVTDRALFVQMCDQLMQSLH